MDPAPDNRDEEDAEEDEDDDDDEGEQRSTGERSLVRVSFIQVSMRRQAMARIPRETKWMSLVQFEAPC